MADEQRSRTFEDEAQGNSGGLLIELWQFLSQNKKWWLLPILVVLCIFGALMLLGGTVAAPFIYSIF